MYTFIVVCMYVCNIVYACVRMCVCTQACMYACIIALMYACMHARMSACSHLWAHVWMGVCMTLGMRVCMLAWMPICVHNHKVCIICIKMFVIVFLCDRVCPYSQSNLYTQTYHTCSWVCLNVNKCFISGLPDNMCMFVCVYISTIKSPCL